MDVYSPDVRSPYIIDIFEVNGRRQRCVRALAR